MPPREFLISSSHGAVTVPGAVRSHTVAGIPDGASRTFTIRGSNDLGEGPASAPVTGTTWATPEAPVASAIAGPDPGRITVTWVPPTNEGGRPIEAYRVYVGNAPGQESFVVEAPPGDRAYVEAQLGPGVFRSFRVSARNALGEGPPSAPTGASSHDLPAAPSGLVATVGPEPGVITLRWNAPTVPPTSLPTTEFRVYRGPPGGPHVLRASLGATEYRDTGVLTTAEYEVRAVNAVGEGGGSRVAATPLRPFTARHGAVSVWTGTEMLVFGGEDAAGSRFLDVARYDPTTKATAIIPGTGLPSNRSYASAVWTGQTALLFGGTGCGGDCSEILSFDPNTGAFRLAGHLPSPRSFTGAVWDPANAVAYVFGGRCGEGYCDTIVRFDPATGAAAVMAAKLTSGRAGVAAVWTGTEALLFGGIGRLGASDEILVYRPDEDILAPALARLPSGRGLGAAVFDGRNAFHFGGCAATTDTSKTPPQTYFTCSSQVVRVSRNGETAVTMAAAIDRQQAAVSWTGTRATLVGGCLHGCALPWVAPPGPKSALSTSAEYAIIPGVPLATTVVPGARSGELHVSWTPPHANTYSYLTGYEIARKGPYDPAYRLVARVEEGPYLDTGLEHAAVYAYEVRAINAATDAGPAGRASGQTRPNPALAATPTPPRSLLAQSGIEGVTFTWQKPNVATQTEYRLSRVGPEGAETHLATIPASATSYALTGVSAGTATYSLRAVNAEGPSAAATTSGTAWARTPPASPVGVTATPGPARGEIRLAWTAGPANGGPPPSQFLIYRRTEAGDYALAGSTTNTFYSDQNRPDDWTDFYRVAASSSGGESPGSLVASARTFRPPSAPTGLTATPGPGGGEITLRWNAPLDSGGTEVRRYEVYELEESGARWIGFTAWSQFTHAGRGPGTTVTYVVRATNPAGTGEASLPATATTFHLPGAPENLVATSGPLRGEVSLAWSPPSEDGGAPVGRYHVYGGAAGNPQEYVGQATGRAFVHRGMTDDAEWVFAVAAVSVAGESNRSAKAHARTLARPAAPDEVFYGPGEQGTRVTWAPPSSDGGAPVTKYRIYRWGLNLAAVLVHETDATTTEWSDTETTAARHSYGVSAVNLVGEGAVREGTSTYPEDTAPPNAPSMTTASRTTRERELRIAWDAAESSDGSPILGYVIHRGRTVASIVEFERVGPATGFTDATPEAGVEYFYRVAGYTAGGDGPPGPVASATAGTRPGAPTNLRACADDGAVLLMWAAPQNDGGVPLTRYAIYRKGAAEDWGIQLGETDASTNQFRDTTGRTGTAYHYWATARNHYGEGGPSDSVVEPFPPRGMTSPC